MSDTADDDDITPFRDPLTERIVSLILVLQSNRYGYTRNEILQRVPGYEQNSDASLRMFERDKRLLLSLGFPVEGEQRDPLDPSSFRYRINPQQAQVPQLEFSEGERRALQAALSAWHDTSFASNVNQAGVKLEALGITLPKVEPLAQFHLVTDMENLLTAINLRHKVRFSYRKPGQVIAEERKVDPYTLAMRDGEYFLIGWDADRQSVRLFNLARVSGRFVLFGSANSFTVPDDFDLSQAFNFDVQPELKVPVKLRLAPNRGQYWRMISGETDYSREVEIDLELSSPYRMLPLLAADAGAVQVLDPPEIRDRVNKLVRGANGLV